MNDDTARARFMVISMLRFAGLAVVLIGLLIVNDVIPLPKIAGYVLLVVGVIDIFLVPQVLARKWRTPKQ